LGCCIHKDLFIKRAGERETAKDDVRKREPNRETERRQDKETDGGF